MTDRSDDAFSLVADIGGTNTRVAVARGTALRKDTIRRFSNAEHEGLEAVLRHYLKDIGKVDCKGACVAVAGPVRDGVGAMTNLHWTIDTTTLARATNATNARVINDLQAQGHSLGHLSGDKTPVVLKAPPHSPRAVRLVIGVGTGFNAAAVYETEYGRLVPPSECGHANLPVRTGDELRLLRFVETAHGFPAVEDVLSGRGLERIYAWLSSEAGHPAKRKAADIMTSVETGDDAIATEAVARFVRILGTVAGNLSLIHLPFGGVYMAGGVARALGPYLVRFGFGDAFRDKGRFDGFMRNFGVSLIEDDYAALTGCAHFLGQTHV
ncbi:MAG: glucokinase [Pseudomonadota bacterium]